MSSCCRPCATAWRKPWHAFPDYATAWGLLSQTYIDQMRFSYPFDPRTSPETIDRALAAAKRAVELDPLNVRALEAEMTALYFARDIEGALEAGKRAMEINPNDIELMKEYGSWLAQSGNWADGCQLTKEAVARNPARMAYSEAALALCAYFAGQLRRGRDADQAIACGQQPDLSRDGGGVSCRSRP